MSQTNLSQGDLTVELVSRHLDDLAAAARVAQSAAPVVAGWGERLAEVFAAGGKLIACGNGGSAAEAQHLTGELLGRFEKWIRNRYGCFHGLSITKVIPAVKKRGSS